MNDQRQNAPRGRAAYDIYIGLDARRAGIAAAYAEPGRKPAEPLARIDNTPDALAGLVREAADRGAALWCCEIGPCGNKLQRRLQELGQECGLTDPRPRRLRAKRGRRGAADLARELRDGRLEPQPLWASPEEREEVRHWWEFRCLLKNFMLQRRQRLHSQMQSFGHYWPGGRKRWTPEHFRWLEQRELDSDTMRWLRDSELSAVRDLAEKVAELDQRLQELRRAWSPEPRPGEAPHRED